MRCFVCGVRYPFLKRAAPNDARVLIGLLERASARRTPAFRVYFNRLLKNLFRSRFPSPENTALPTTANGSLYIEADSEPPTDDFQQDYLNRLTQVVGRNVVDRWRNELMQSRQLDYESRSQWKDWFDKKIKKYGPKFERVSCRRTIPLYSSGGDSEVPQSGTLIECDWCSRFTSSRIPRCVRRVRGVAYRPSKPRLLYSAIALPSGYREIIRDF